MKTWMMWHGGGSYAAGDLATDIEAFDSLAAARHEFARRARTFDPYYPMVDDVPPADGGPSAWLFFADPNAETSGNTDYYPDRVLEFGPNGGLTSSPG